MNYLLTVRTGGPTGPVQMATLSDDIQVIEATLRRNSYAPMTEGERQALLTQKHVTGFDWVDVSTGKTLTVQVGEFAVTTTIAA